VSRALAGLTLLALTLLAMTASGCAADPPAALVGIRTEGCAPRHETGSGMFVAVDGLDEPLVLTAAHVVAGAREIEVTRGGATGSGRVVAFDPDMDLALVAVDGLDVARLGSIDSAGVAAGDHGVAYVVRDGEPVAVPVTVRRRVRIRTEDIYVEGETVRPGYELTAALREGDSGGAVVVEGKIVGVLWARSRQADDRAYAVDPVRAGELVGAQLAARDLGDVDLGRCP
jgi:S1-C subfamily serine protease